MENNFREIMKNAKHITHLVSDNETFDFLIKARKATGKPLRDKWEKEEIMEYLMRAERYEAADRQGFLD